MLNIDYKLFEYTFIKFSNIILSELGYYLIPLPIKLFLTNHYSESFLHLNLVLNCLVIVILFIIYFICFKIWNYLRAELKQLNLSNLNLNINTKNYFISTGLIFYFSTIIILNFYLIKFNLSFPTESIYNPYINLATIYLILNNYFIIIYVYGFFILINLIHLILGIYMFYYDYITDHYCKLLILTIYILYVIMFFVLITLF